ncbi:MAG: hypothetical protein JSR59_20415 [Proteobacteria bacterium]|nr:hypothetical protein [Pseudomonadota bacterium]
MSARLFFAGRSLALFRLLLINLACAAAVVACGGGSDPRDEPPVQATATFTAPLPVASDGSIVSAPVSAKGTSGTPRTTTPAAGETTYALSAADLQGPYMLQGPGGVAATLQTGRANLTELTSLQAGVLFGQDALAAYAAFGGNPAQSALLTAANRQAAQAKVTDFVQNVLGVTVKSADADFVTSPYQPVAGDPMFDTLVALDARIAALGPEAYQTLVTDLVAEAGRCLVEKVSIQAAGASFDFCPATKTATHETSDTTVIDYVFADHAGDVLTVRVRGDTVLDASYVTAAQATYACSGCSTITLGTPSADDSRTLTFAATAFAGGSGSAVVSGTLTGAVPDVVLPTLPCNDNRYFLVLPDRSVLADCVSISTGLNFLGIPASAGIQQGSTAYATYAFANLDGSNSVPAPAVPTAVNVVLNGGDLVSVTVTHRDPTSGALTTDYKCRASDCSGVSVGPATVNTDFGFNIEIRTITFAGTPLAAVGADGTLSSGTTAQLSGSLTGIYYSALDAGAFAPIVDSMCEPYTQKVLVAPADESYVYAVCPEIFGSVPPVAAIAPLDGGGSVISLPPGGTADSGNLDLLFDHFVVVLDASGTVTSATAVFNGSLLGENFGCAGDCAGITVGAAAPDGSRSVTISGATFHVIEPDGFPTGLRTATINGSFSAAPGP